MNLKNKYLKELLQLKKIVKRCISPRVYTRGSNDKNEQKQYKNYMEICREIKKRRVEELGVY